MLVDEVVLIEVVLAIELQNIIPPEEVVLLV
jgi:hypothetical protein